MRGSFLIWLLVSISLCHAEIRIANSPAVGAVFYSTDSLIFNLEITTREIPNRIDMYLAPHSANNMYLAPLITSTPSLQNMQKSDLQIRPNSNRSLRVAFVAGAFIDPGNYFLAFAAADLSDSSAVTTIQIRSSQPPVFTHNQGDTLQQPPTFYWTKDPAVSQVQIWVCSSPVHVNASSQTLTWAQTQELLNEHAIWSSISPQSSITFGDNPTFQRGSLEPGTAYYAYIANHISAYSAAEHILSTAMVFYTPPILTQTTNLNPSFRIISPDSAQIISPTIAPGNSFLFRWSEFPQAQSYQLFIYSHTGTTPLMQILTRDTSLLANVYNTLPGGSYFASVQAQTTEYTIHTKAIPFTVKRSQTPVQLYPYYTDTTGVEQFVHNAQYLFRAVNGLPEVKVIPTLTQSSRDVHVQLMPGDYEVTTYHPQWDTITQIVSINGSSLQTIQTYFGMQASQALAIQYTPLMGDSTYDPENLDQLTTGPTYTLQAHITHNQQAVNPATVTLSDTNGLPLHTASTNSSGFAVIQAPPGTYTLQVNAQGLQTKQMALPLYMHRNINVALQGPATRLTGTVTIRQETAANQWQTIRKSGILVTMRSTTSSQSFVFTTNGQGNFWADVAPGSSWMITAHHNNYIDSSLFTAGSSVLGTQTVQLTLQQQAQIQGYIQVLQASTPLSISILATDTLSGKQILKSITANQALTQYTLKDVPAGVWKIEAGSQGLYSTNQVFVTVSMDDSFISRYINLADTLTVSSSEQSILIRFTTPSDSSIPGTIVVEHPGKATFQADSVFTSTTQPLLFHAKPHADSLLIIESLSYKPDTTLDTALVTIPFAFYHNHQSQLPLQANDSIYTLSLYALDSTIQADSVFLYSNGIRYTPSASDSGFYDFNIPVSPAVPRLQYWFQAFLDSLVYSNQKYPYTTTLNYPSVPIQLIAPFEDTTAIALGAQWQIPVIVLNAITLAPLDNSRLQNTTITWKSSNNKQSLLAPANSLQATLQATSTSSYFTVQVKAQSGTFRDSITMAFSVVNKDVQVLKMQNIPAEAIQNDSIPLFTLGLDTITSANQWIIMNPEYTVTPALAGTISQQSLHIHPRFIGPVQLIATHQGTADTAYIDVLGKVSQNHPASTFFHDSLFQMIIPDSAQQQYPKVFIQLHSIATNELAFQGERGTFAPHFYGYSIRQYRSLHHKPQVLLRLPQPEFLPTSSVTLMQDSLQSLIPLTPDSAQAYFLGKAPASMPQPHSTQVTDTAGLAWIKLQANMIYPVVYGLFVADTALHPQELTLMPNPFSPYITAHADGNDQPGLRIRYLPRSGNHGEALVSIHIYNMNGELVRTLLHQALHQTHVHTLYWDGYAQSGRMLRNGRYLLQYTTRDPDTKKIHSQILKPVVLFK
jgi:hypothetical protein